MISILTGLPRSGKSYRAVWYIYNNFIDPDSKLFNKYRYLHTNIGGFRFKEINETLVSAPVVTDDDVYIKETIYLDWNPFYKHIEKLHEMALADKSDNELLTYARYHKLSPALIVIDEAYRFYKKKSDPVLVWLNGYHGHLGLDLLFIIHKPTLMNSDYIAHTEEFIDAQPKSKSITNNTFRYVFYPTSNYNKTDKYHSEKLIADSKIFALYQSGDLHNPKKILHKFIGFIIAGVLMVLFFGYIFYSRMASHLNPEQLLDEQNASITSPVSVSSAPQTLKFSDDSIVLTIRCDYDFCSRVDPKFQTHYIAKSTFNDLLTLVDSKVVSIREYYMLDNYFIETMYLVPKKVENIYPTFFIPLPSNSQPQNMGSGSKPLDGVS